MVMPVHFDMEGLKELWKPLPPQWHIVARHSLECHTQIPPFQPNDSKATKTNTRWQLACQSYNTVVLFTATNR